MKKYILVLFALLLIAGCSYKEDIERLTQLNRELRQDIRQLEQQLEDMKAVADKEVFLARQLQNVRARIITNVGEIEVEFYPDDAPIHVFNFITRAESGFYDGTKFHRVIPGFMIQGGDPNTKTDNRSSYGQGGGMANIPHEFNNRTHERGVLSMARVSDVSQGAGTQFFIMHANTPRLDNEYTVFGKAISGLDVVDKIATTETSSRYRDQPVSDMVIERVEVYRR